MAWEDITDNFTKEEEDCLMCMLRNGQDNCFSVRTVSNTKSEGFSGATIKNVIRKLEDKNLCVKIPKDIFSIMWGWLYAPDFAVVVAWGMHLNGKKVV